MTPKILIKARTLTILTCLLVALATPALSADEPGPAAAKATPEADGTSPWQTLADLRTNLIEAGPTRAEFTQTYVPAGFSGGERESGAMSFDLPDCMRWDYTEPYAKTFLLCGDRAHYWNEEDRSGRRYDVDRQEEPGLDLLMLSVDTLRERYDATAEPQGDGRVRVTLEPLTDVGSLAEATLTVAAGGDRLSQLSYRDREGNLTRFSLAEPTPLADPDDVFLAPGDVRWQD